MVVTFSNCDDDDDILVAFDFTLNNLAGNYNINSYGADLTNTANTQGTEVTISTAVKVGDTFQVDLTLNADGTFTATGQYRVVTTVTPVSGSQTVTPEILNVSNEGTFSISTTGARTINFIATNGDFLSGEYRVNFFDEDSLTLIQDKSEVDGNITTQTITTIAFGRD